LAIVLVIRYIGLSRALRGLDNQQSASSSSVR
jgi:hypothetical protein